MFVLIATAEPRGAYHLAPLGSALESSSASFTHLVPYPEPVQGDPVVDVSNDVNLIERCDRLVVTGGTFSAWTALVVFRALTLGKPIVFSELAYVSGAEPFEPAVRIARATALSPDGAGLLRRYLGVDEVTVTGTPSLDRLPTWKPVERRALLLSTVDMTLRDPDLSLLTVAGKLTEAGWDVRVRTHPRENVDVWHGFQVVSGETQAESASTAQVVIGYPGSAHVLAAAVGAPVIALAPTETLRRVLTPHTRAVMSAVTRGVDDTMKHIPCAATPDPAAIFEAVGPIGGAAERIVDTWTTPL